MALLGIGAILLIFGTLIGGWAIDGLLLGIGWRQRKQWLMLVGGIPFTLLSLAILGVVVLSPMESSSENDR